MVEKLTENQDSKVKYVIEDPQNGTFYNKKKDAYVNSVEQATPYISPDLAVIGKLKLGGSEEDFKQGVENAWNDLDNQNAVGIVRDEQNNVSVTNDAYKFDAQNHTIAQIDPNQVEIEGKPKVERYEPIEKPDNNQYSYEPLAGDFGVASGFSGSSEPYDAPFQRFDHKTEATQTKTDATEKSETQYEQTSLFSDVDFDNIGNEKDDGLQK